MVKGTMKWTNSTNQFGFLAPDDGSRDVFVRLSSGFRSRDTTNEQDDSVLPNNEVVSTAAPDHRAEAHVLASLVEVRARYQRGHWAPGYEIAE
jgi:cold shock CspA family protein